MFGKLSRDKTKWVIVSIILVVLLIGGVMLYKRIDDGVTTKRLSSLDYAVGSIDAATGKYSSDKTAIYTKEFLSAKDIKIELKENSNVSYKIFIIRKIRRSFPHPARLPQIMRQRPIRKIPSTSR